MRTLLLAILLVALSAAAAYSAEGIPQGDEEAAIRKAVESYVVAFNQGDAKALATLWSPEAVYTNPLSGMLVVGRAAIEKQFASIFADEQKVQLAATTESIRFLSPGVAVENGTAKLLRGGKEVEQSSYTAIYVKRDGQWLLDRVTEEDLVEPPSHYEQLKPLEWLVGRWTDQDDQATVLTECHWAKNNNFLVRSFTVQIRDRIDMAGIQVVGWDPAAKRVRSWVFDSDGGFGEGTWTNKGDRWHIQLQGVLADGRKTSAITIMTRLDANTCTLQSVSRTVDGELLPNIDEVKIHKE
ncbi:MAG: SgcJ/EcaC family oxidoreductase [Pirellulales bacterium]